MPQQPKARREEKCASFNLGKDNEKHLQVFQTKRANLIFEK
jgi:hypothetical protein